MGLMGVQTRLTATGKWDIAKDNLGRIKTVIGSNKLILQVARAVMNSNVFNNMINQKSTQPNISLISTILAQFRSSQVDLTNELPSDLDGYNIYKGSDGVNYSPLLSYTVNNEITDKDVTNGVPVYYYFTSVQNGIESSPFYALQVTPSANIQSQDIFVNPSVLVEEGNGQIVFNFLSLRTFDSRELLDVVDQIFANIDTADPRKLALKIKFSNLAKNILDLSGNSTG